MPPKRIVRQLLAGRKRKAQTTGISSRANASRDVIENHRGATENIRPQWRSPTIPPALVPKTSIANNNTEPQHADYENMSSERELIGSPPTNRIQQFNTHSLETGAKVSAATKDTRTEALSVPRPSTIVFETKPATSTKSLVANQPQQQQDQPRKQTRPYQYRITSRYRRRVRETHGQKQKNSSKNASGIDTISMGANRKRDYRNMRTTKSPALLKKDDGAERLVRTFLEERRDRRFHSPNTLLSSTSTPHSILDDQALLPFFLLGVSALSHIVEWHDRKQKEAEFAESQLARELVLWMKSRQEMQAAYTSESLVRKHAETMNHLAKFQESIEDCHQASLELSAQQREEETLLKERGYHQKETESATRNTARTKCAFYPFGSYEEEEGSAEGLAIANDSDIQLSQTDSIGGDDQKKQSESHDHSQVERIDEKPKPKISMDSTESKHDNTSQPTGKTVLFEKATETLDFSSHAERKNDQSEDKILPSTSQASVPMFRNNVDCAAEKSDEAHNASLMTESVLVPTSIDGVKEGDSPLSDVQQPLSYGVGERTNDVVAYDVDCWNSTNSDSFPDDMSEVLLSQARNKLPRPRRITTSPRNFSEEPGQKPTERYKHYTQIDFTGQQQSADGKRGGIYFDRQPFKKVKRSKRNNILRQSSHQPLDKGWVSKTAKRSPTLKQTSLLPSGGWVSNRGARNFVRNEPSPRTIAMMQTTPMSDVPSHKGNSTSDKGEFDTHEKKGQERTPLASVTILPTNGLVSPTSKTTNPETNIAEKLPTPDLPSHNKPVRFKQHNVESPCHGKQRRILRPKDTSSRGVSDDGGNSGIGKSFDKSNESVNSYAYEEVVRGKAAREALNGYECKECAAFFDEAVLHGDGANYYNRDELLRCSRHRARQTPPQTPEDFWDLSFRDEKLEREKQESRKTKTKFSFNERQI